MALAGQRIKALDFTPAVGMTDTTAHLNLTTTPAVGSPEVGVAFVAPTSGKIALTISASVADSSGNNIAGILDFQLYLGTSAAGTLVLSSSIINRLILQAGDVTNESQEASRTSFIAGLAAGADYYVRTRHSAFSGSTLDLYARTVFVQPLPA